VSSVHIGTSSNSSRNAVTFCPIKLPIINVTKSDLDKTRQLTFVLHCIIRIPDWYINLCIQINALKFGTIKASFITNLV